MPILFCPRLPPAESLSERPERDQRAADTHGCFVTIRNGGFYQRKIPGVTIRNSLMLSTGNP